MKLFKGFLLSLFMLMGTLGFTQSGWSSNTYYGEQGGYINEYVGTNTKWVCCNAWGQGAWVTCNTYKETVWKRAYGYKQVRMWNYQTGSWYWVWREDWYWYYVWRYYDVC